MVPKIQASLSGLNTSIKSAPTIGGPVSSSDPIAQKTVGEVPPQVVDPSQFPELASLLTQYGVVSRIRRKLMLLSGKKGKILLAKNTIGAADNKGFVYLGVDFLQQYQNDPALLAGVMAHEWGHLVSNLIKHGPYADLSWDEIFELRREEEASADAFCGRTMPLMGYSVEPLVAFLTEGKDKKENHKYYSAHIRADIIRRAAATTAGRQAFSKRLFSSSVYSNPYTSILLIG